MSLKPSNKRLFFRKTTDTVYFLSLSLLALLLMVLDQRQQPEFERVRMAFAVLVYPLQVLIDLPTVSGRWSLQHIAEHRQLVAENERLQIEHQYLQVSLLKLQALEVENQRLRELLSAAQPLSGRVAMADIMAVDLDPYRHQLLLNKGAQGQVYEGQPLLDANGILGQVTQVNAISAMAMLITDPEHATPVQIKRNGLRTIALGRGNIDQIELPFLPQNADVKVGDVLLTSGLDGRFPAGYPVAVVTTIEYPTGHEFAEISAHPTANLQQHRHVLLMWPAPAVDAAAAVNAPAVSNPLPNPLPNPISTHHVPNRP